jgi:Na+/proline symporter
MKEIYWIQVIGNVGDMTAAVLIFAIFASILLAVGVIAYDTYDNEGRERQYQLLKRFMKYAFITLFIAAIGFVFIPSNKQMLAIYGVGGTIDYIKNNDKAKELPDKVVDALTRYLDEVCDNEKK